MMDNSSRSAFKPKWAGFFILLAILLFVDNKSTAQVKVTGGFIQDSVKIGERVSFYVAAKYPRELSVLFVDSTHNFLPFEFQEKKYFATETEDGISRDSTIYYLSTFELGPSLSLDLPAYVINDNDSTEYRSSADSILVIQTMKENIDSISIEQLPLRMNTAYHEVNYQFNYFVVFGILGVLLLSVVIVWIIFGKRITRYYKAKRLQKRHQQFVESFNSVISDVQQAFSPLSAESALSLWKKYMEQLESTPYTKLTTRETYALSRDEALGRNLTAIDRAIYGHDTSISEPLAHLRAVADDRFSKKLQEVKHGK